MRETRWSISAAHRVDVAEEDPVQRVVDHHVEALDRAHRGDLRHAQARAEVRQAHVAAVLLRPLVERLAHDPEVLLRGERAAVALRRRAVGHVVEQALRGRADHRDDVAARLRRPPARARRPRRCCRSRSARSAAARRARPAARASLAALLACAAHDPPMRSRALARSTRSPDRLVLGARQLAAGRARPRSTASAICCGVAPGLRASRCRASSAMPRPSPPRVVDVVDEHVRQRHVELVGAVDAEQARDACARPTPSSCRRSPRRRASAIRARGLAAGFDDARVEVELRRSRAAALTCRSLTIGNGITSRSESRSVRIITSRSTPMPPPAVGE